MHIDKAKQQILTAAAAYFAKDEDGLTRIPSSEQRPVLLMGPPGIGKTAIVRQAAEELGIGFISYSMTHHTRQSALGLPVIKEREYDGQVVQISEYTMSEIIASVYDLMKDTGTRQGILFLDEINCVSETLTPVMLQFLQFKVFGKHALPEGWMVVAAGNPPEYNRSARLFDVVTLDRLKVIEIEPDFEAWRRYALSRGTNPAVMGFLSSHRDRFYEVSASDGGRVFATARGWTDLADMLTVCEAENLPVDRDLIGEYIRHPAAADEFAVYYKLYRKYQSDYQVERILAGEEDSSVRDRAKAAPFDERVSLLTMLLRSACGTVGEAVLEEDVCRALHAALSSVKAALLEAGTSFAVMVENASTPGAGNSAGAFSGADRASASAQDDPSILKAQMEAQIKVLTERLSRDRLRGILTRSEEKKAKRVLDFLKETVSACTSFDEVRVRFRMRVAAMQALTRQASDRLDHLFDFCGSVWPDGTEMVLLVTHLTARTDCARFIASHGCAAYERYADLLQLDTQSLLEARYQRFRRIGKEREA